LRIDKWVDKAGRVEGEKGVDAEKRAGEKAEPRFRRIERG
jgi:hypothetical protein